jgi:hypothetical protein
MEIHYNKNNYHKYKWFITISLLIIVFRKKLNYLSNIAYFNFTKSKILKMWHNSILSF